MPTTSTKANSLRNVPSIQHLKNSMKYLKEHINRLEDYRKRGFRVTRRIKPYYEKYYKVANEIKRRESIVILQMLLKNKSLTTGFKNLPVDIQQRIIKNAYKWFEISEKKIHTKKKSSMKK